MPDQGRRARDPAPGEEVSKCAAAGLRAYFVSPRSSGEAKPPKPFDGAWASTRWTMPELDTSALIAGFCDDTPLNPSAARAEDATVAWLWRIGFITTPAQEAHLRSFKFGIFHGLTTPHIEFEPLALGMKWFCWGSLADDQYDNYCLLYTSPSPRDGLLSRMPSSA